MGVIITADTGKLTTYGNYLINAETKLNALLDTLNEKMSGITTGWSDVDGQNFATKFADFITAAKTVNTELGTLGKFAKDKAAQYDALLKDSLAMMDNGG